MVDTAKLIAELRAALDGVTPGPWTLEIEGHDYVVRSASRDYMMCDTTYYPTALELKDARFVVAANPANIRILLDALAAAEAEADRLTKALALAILATT